MLDSLNWRYATKQFDASRKVSAEDWQILEDSLVLTPSSFGLQPWKFHIITDQKIKDALKENSWNQEQVSDCSHLVVFTSRTEVTDSTIDEWMTTLAEVQNRETAELAGYRGMVDGFVQAMSPQEVLAWTQRQAYIAIGQFMTVAAHMKIDTCPLEGISPTAYDSILGIEDSGFKTVVACAVGYRHTDDKYADTPKARFAKEQVINHV